MDYTISFDASLKIKKGQEKGYINHLARDVFDNENGYSLQHGNDKINKDLTNQNQTFVNDGNGSFKDMKSISEATDYLDERLSTVKKKLRKDAVIARPLIFQLDSEYVKTHSEDEVFDRFNNMLDWAANEFGIDNLVCGSLHMDETNPHLHLMFTPVTEDGRLSQTDWFKSPATLKKQHDAFRKHMQDNDYNATNQRTTGGRKGLPIAEYKAFMSMSDKITEIVDRELELGDKEMALKGRKIDLEERNRHLDTLALEIKLNAEKEAQRVIDEAQEVRDEAKRRLVQAEATLKDAQERAEDIKEKAEMDAKRLRTGARATGRKVDNIASNTKEMQRSKRARDAEMRFGDLF